MINDKCQYSPLPNITSNEVKQEQNILESTQVKNTENKMETVASDGKIMAVEVTALSAISTGIGFALAVTVGASTPVTLGVGALYGISTALTGAARSFTSKNERVIEVSGSLRQKEKQD